MFGLTKRGPTGRSHMPTTAGSSAPIPPFRSNGASLRRTLAGGLRVRDRGFR
jgi:hypothetical protein